LSRRESLRKQLNNNDLKRSVWNKRPYRLLLLWKPNNKPRSSFKNRKQRGNVYKKKRRLGRRLKGSKKRRSKLRG
jgi:hypothetical protein